ncbi:helix-turn-helix domain-containing protein [Empedobacter brevis]|uniref:helix-turn-helix domain-containing protein n=1 Tax=Empedobacter brevis TaxID=247 RepID=UPI0039B07436
MKHYENLKETLSFYGINCNKLYYISSGNPIFEFPEQSFRIDFYAFCICLAGTIELEIDSQKYSITQNEFLILAPSTVLKIVDNSSDFKMKLLFFEKNFLLKNISNPFFIDKLNLFTHQNFTICKASKKEVSHLFMLINYLQEQQEREVLFLEDIIRSIIFTLLLASASIIAEQQIKNNKNDSSEINTLFCKFTQLVQENVIEHKNVQFYADQLFITNKYLIHLVKKATNKTPHVIIDEYLLKEAYVQLCYSEKTIAQIALELGFNSPSSFGRFFKKYTSTSPQQYRKEQHL